jgi:hypothetical protein
MLAGFEHLENLNLYSAGDDATFSEENATEPAEGPTVASRVGRAPRWA